MGGAALVGVAVGVPMGGPRDGEPGPLHTERPTGSDSSSSAPDHAPLVGRRAVLALPASERLPGEGAEAGVGAGEDRATALEPNGPAGELARSLKEAGIELLDYAELSDKQLDNVKRYYDEVVFPVLTPLAHDPALLARTWSQLKVVMGPGQLSPQVKEMIYLAVSVTNQCGYCIASHTAAARKKGMTDAMLAELMAVVGMANETNRLAAGYQVEVDDQFK